MNELELTEEQMEKVCDTLEKSRDDKTVKELENASKMTEKSNYTKKDNNIIEFPSQENEMKETNLTEKNYKEAFSTYGVSELDAEKLLKIIEDYKHGTTENIYSKLPDSMKTIVSGLAMNNGVVNKSYLNAAAKMLIEEFINDAEFDAAYDEYNNEMSKTITEMGKEYDELVKEGINNIFNNIDNIREEDPDKAKLIESLKYAFESSTKFEREKEFAKNISPKKMNKLCNRWKDEAYYFNKRVNSNSFGIKIGNIENIIPVLEKALPELARQDLIKRFIVVLSKTIGDVEDLANIAYIYKMVDNILLYDIIDSADKDIFNNISEVITNTLF